MKKSLIALFMSFSTLSAYAQGDITIKDLATNPDTKAEFQKMTGKQDLPKWITQGGTDSPSKEVEINGGKYLVLHSCKPHDCASQSIAVLYAPESKKLAGVLSTSSEEEMSQKLRWLNIPDELSIDGKTALFAALTGSLDNHPGNFNFK